MTAEELRERIDKVCEANGWIGHGLDFVFDDPDPDYRGYFVFMGYVFAMLNSRIITKTEGDLLLATMLENRFFG